MQTLTRELVTALGVIDPTMKEAGKGKKHLDDVIRGLEDWNAKWFEELLSKVKAELAQSAEDDLCSSSHSRSASKPYQPTVEDIRTPEDEFELGRSFMPPSAASPPQAPRTSPPPSPSSSSSSSSSSSPSPAPSSSSSSPPSSPASSYSYGNTPLHSRPNSPSSITTKPANDPREPKPPMTRPGVRFSDRQPPLAPVLMNPPRRLDSTGPPRLSPVDAKWGTLFDERDEPTPDLGRLLRGIANYIIAEYAPTDSLVITPDKLSRFYTDYKLDEETIPFQRIFDTRHPRALRAIELLFLDLRCEHHLVPPPRSPAPRVPALTPAGFQAWATLLIRAAPGREARRLALVAQDLPLVADGPKPPSRPPSPERLPRQLSRHLFPAHPSPRALDALASACAAWRALVVGADERQLPPPRHARGTPARGVGDERAGRSGSSGSSSTGRSGRGRRMDAAGGGYVCARSREPSPPGLAERSHRRR